MPPAPGEFIPRQQNSLNANVSASNEDSSQQLILYKSLNEHLRDEIKKLKNERDAQREMFTKKALESKEMRHTIECQNQFTSSLLKNQKESEEQIALLENKVMNTAEEAEQEIERQLMYSDESMQRL